MTKHDDDPDDGDLVAAPTKIPVPDDVADAVRTLIRWAGDDPDARRVCSTRRSASRARGRNIARAMARIRAHHLSRVFEEVGGYDEIVLLKDIPFQSHCEHHMAPIIGKAHDRLSAATTMSSASPSSRACCTASRGGCRCRSG